MSVNEPSPDTENTTPPTIANDVAIKEKSFISFPNVRDHRWLPVARLLLRRSEAESAGGVTRVAISVIALLGVIFISR
jgi:hypothetical protein